MKRAVSFLAVSLFILGAFNTASAQQQTFTIFFPQISALAISADPAPLELTDVTVTPTGATWTAVSSAPTELYQINNYGSGSNPLFITVDADFASIGGDGKTLTGSSLAGTGLGLKLAATFQSGAAGGTGVAGGADLSDGNGHNLVTGVSKGYSKFELVYTLTGTEDAESYEEIEADVVFTVTESGI